MEKRLPHVGGFILAFQLSILMWAGCASAVRASCEFPLWVRVVPGPQAEDECRARGGKNWRRDDGSFVEDSDSIRGCAPENLIITNGVESNAGHELMHHIRRNCK